MAKEEVPKIIFHGESFTVEQKNERIGVLTETMKCI